MRLSDHIKIEIHRDGEATCDVEMDKLMKEMSDNFLEKLNSKLTREQADEAFSDLFCESIRQTFVEMSDEAFGDLLARFVEEFSCKEES